MTKYQEYFKFMLENNKELFDEFREIHDRYALEKDLPAQAGKIQEEFNKIGSQVQSVIRTWEDKLCGRSESSGYASYSGNLAQKFQDEVRHVFPFIDSIGIIVSTPPIVEESVFNLKKINL